MARFAERVSYRDLEGDRWYAGLALYTYQLTLGVTLRWYDGQPHARVYLGPLKLFAGRRAFVGQPAFTGGDR